MLGASTLPLYYMCIIQYNIQYIVVMLLCYVFLVENLSFAGMCPKWSQMAGRDGNSPGELKIFRASLLFLFLTLQSEVDHRCRTCP